MQIANFRIESPEWTCLLFVRFFLNTTVLSMKYMYLFHFPLDDQWRRVVESAQKRRTVAEARWAGSHFPTAGGQPPGGRCIATTDVGRRCTARSDGKPNTTDGRSNTRVYCVTRVPCGCVCNTIYCWHWDTANMWGNKALTYQLWEYDILEEWLCATKFKFRYKLTISARFYICRNKCLDDTKWWVGKLGTHRVS